MIIHRRTPNKKMLKYPQVLIIATPLLGLFHASALSLLHAMSRSLLLALLITVAPRAPEREEIRLFVQRSLVHAPDCGGERSQNDLLIQTAAAAVAVADVDFFQSCHIAIGNL
jgi:hypothetical protein